MLDRLERELGVVLAGTTVETATVHGDYWPGNLLVTDDGSRVTGIVDWDLAAHGAPPLCDYLHLLLYTRRLVLRREYGQIVADALDRAVWDPVEAGVVRQADQSWIPDARLRIGVLLTWLRHVGSVAPLPDHGENGIWVRRNVGVVLERINRMALPTEHWSR
jgi:hypothetical protein